MSRCFKLTIAYDGTAYVGWQRQPDGVSIQQLIEEACAPLAGNRPPAVTGASRTDAGAHARGQVASVRLPTTLAPETIVRALNFRLPADVRVLAVEEAAPTFHARFDAVGKHYQYRVVTAPVLLPFDRWFAWHAPDVRDVAAIRAAAGRLVGRHDFASFQGAGGQTLDTIRTIRRFEVRELDGELIFDVEGDGFLRHMVRAMVGTLADIGARRRPSASIVAALEARDRRAAGLTAPAAGLTLVGVNYR